METESAPVKSPMILSNENLSGANPLLWLFGRLPGGVVQGAVLFTLGFTLVRGIIALIHGNLTTEGKIVGFLNDPAMYANLVGISAIWMFNAWSPHGIRELFNRLFGDRIIGRTIEERYRSNSAEHEHRLWLGEMIKSMQSQTWTIVALVVALVAAGLALPDYITRDDTWSMTNTPSIALSTLWSAYTVFGVAYFIITCLLTAIWARRLFRCFTADVRPLHPDGTGGLEPLVQFSMRITSALVLIGSMIVVMAITRHYLATGVLSFSLDGNVITALSVYLVIAPLTFFLFTAIPHQAMVESKQKALRSVSTHFCSVQKKLFDSFDSDESVDEPAIDTLRRLGELHKSIRKSPVWPLNTANITKFLTTYLVPVALGILLDALGSFFLSSQ